MKDREKVEIEFECDIFRQNDGRSFQKGKLQKMTNTAKVIVAHISRLNFSFVVASKAFFFVNKKTKRKGNENVHHYSTSTQYVPKQSLDKCLISRRRKTVLVSSKMALYNAIERDLTKQFSAKMQDLK